MPVKQELLRIENGRCHNRQNIEISDLYLYAFHGEITGILSRNSHHSDALVSVLSGETAFDNGTFFFEDRLLYPDQMKQTLSRNVFVMDTDLHIQENLSFLDNYQLIAYPKEILMRNAARRMIELQNLLETIPIPFDVTCLISELSPLHRRLSELYFAYLSHKKLVIIHNLSRFFTYEEYTLFHDYLDIFLREGMDFILVESNVDFLVRSCSNLFFVSQGKTVIQLNGFRQYTVHDYIHDEDETASQVLPSASSAITPDESMPHSLILKFSEVEYAALRSYNFQIHSGEVISITFSDYEEYISLRQLLFGRGVPSEGMIQYNGGPYIAGGTSSAIQRGLCILEQDFVNCMLVPDMNIQENCYLDLMQRIHVPVQPNRYYYSILQRLQDFFDPEDLRKPVSELPVSSRERAVLCKMLLHAPKLLVCMLPYSSMNVTHIPAFMDMIREISHAGTGVLLLNLQRYYNHNAFDREYLSKDGILYPV